MDREAKVKDLLSRHAAASQRKASLEGQCQARKEAFAKFVEEIRAAGYDPKELSAAAKKAEEDLDAEILAFESDLVKVEKALHDFDSVG